MKKLTMEDMLEPERLKRVSRMMRDEQRISVDYASIAYDEHKVPLATTLGVSVIVAPQDQQIALAFFIPEFGVIPGVTMTLIQAEALVSVLKTQIERAADYEEES